MILNAIDPKSDSSSLHQRSRSLWQSLPISACKEGESPGQCYPNDTNEGDRHGRPPKPRRNDNKPERPPRPERDARTAARSLTRVRLTLQHTAERLVAASVLHPAFAPLSA